jgi:DNA-binding response OmpR family regulator
MRTIMVVDDEPDILLTMVTILEKNGYKSMIATNCDEALEKLKKKQPDLILLDIMMPGMPIEKFVKKIKKKTKIIYLTALNLSDEEKASLMNNNKIIGFIEKPFKMDYLLMRINEMVD